MLGLFGNKSDHPLANQKSVQQILDNLPNSDMVAVLEEIGHWIDALFDPANDFRVDHQLMVLKQLDEAAHPYLRKVVQAYFAVIPLTAFQENRLWGILNTFYTQTEHGYHRILLGIREGEKGGAAIRSQVALVCTRGIYAILGRMECAAVRYLQIDPQAWVHLADLYDHAAVEGCLDEGMQLYAGGVGDTTVNRAFASVVMWYSIGVGALRPLDLHISKSIIIQLRKFMTVTEVPRPNSMFIFDLAHPLDPARAKDEGAMYPPSTRFVEIDVPAGYFEGLLKTLAKEMVPEALNLGVPYGAELVAEVVQRVAAYSKLPLPSRRHQRRKISMNVRILNGYEALLGQVESEYGADGAAGDACKVEDISATGMKYMVPSSHANGLRIGSLIGLRPDKAAHWGAGVVRRLRRDEQNNLHVGVRILANKVVGIILEDGSIEVHTQPALLVERSSDGNGENWLLMKPDTYTPTRSPKMAMDGQEFLMLPVGLIEKGADFDMVRYRKMVHEAGGEG